jgi:hypothetical protein
MKQKSIKEIRKDIHERILDTVDGILNEYNEENEIEIPLCLCSLSTVLASLSVSIGISKEQFSEMVILHYITAMKVKEKLDKDEIDGA